METSKIKKEMSLPEWGRFSLDGYVDLLQKYIDEGSSIADNIAKMESPTFNDVIVRFEALNQKLSLHLGMMLHLKSVLVNDYLGIEDVCETAISMYSDYESKLSSHVGLYKAYLAILKSEGFSALSLEQKHIIVREVKEFEDNGISLSKEKQVMLGELKSRISTLQNRFESNVLKATEAWTLHLEDDNRLKGIPVSVVEKCANKAREKGLTGFDIPLQSNIVNTVLDWADDSALREELWRASASRASEIGRHDKEYDNTSIMCELVSLRNKVAVLLGYKSHAAYSITPKMSGAVGVSGVDEFLHKLREASLPKSISDKRDLDLFAKEKLNIINPMPWDSGYIIRQMIKEKFGFDDEQVRDYFKESKVFEGLISLVGRLFGCTFRQVDVSVWHKTVKFFEVIDSKGDLVGGFYADLFAREGKRGGAWMDELCSRISHDDTHQLPVAFLCTNFRMSLDEEESYLTHDDIVTLFHEMGHVLHHIFVKSKYAESGMANVEWDAIELPSQLLEKWAWDKKLLISMSCHKKDSSVIPDEIISPLLLSRHYRAGASYGRQFGLATFDFNIHKKPSLSPSEILDEFRSTMSQSVVPAIHQGSRITHTFTHAFGGGYDAGYFSYSWANSLVADVSAAFDEAGEDGESEVAKKYLKEILEYGSSRPMIESFNAFRGRNPDSKYLIPYLGLE